LIGHSGSHKVQSMHSSGSITRKFGPSWKQSTGHTSTQSVYLHLMQFSVTTKGMTGSMAGRDGQFNALVPGAAQTASAGAAGNRQIPLAAPGTSATRKKPAQRCAGFGRTLAWNMALPTGFEPVF
jgi:hypothetical protein